MMDGKSIIASCSFGKDSVAAIIALEERGIHVDYALYCRIMFDETISAEFPEHEEFIHTKAIPILWNRYGIKTTIIQSEDTYCDIFYTKYKSGKHIGTIYGFPMVRGAWCNDRLKVKQLKQWKKGMSDYISVVGIAADEYKRVNRKKESGTILPLVKYGITEAEAFDLCKREGLLSTAYNNGRTRLGCWFCHNQRLSELRRLRKEYPDLWERLLELDEVSTCSFKPNKVTVQQLDDRFRKEDSQLMLDEIIS